MKKPLCASIFIAVIGFQMVFSQSYVPIGMTGHLSALKPEPSLSISINSRPPLAKTPGAHSSNSVISFADLGFGKTRANDVNIKAVRDFVKTFEGVENNKWCVLTDGTFNSTFDFDGKHTIVSYDRKGNRQHIIRLYSEETLAFKIRDMVKREYYDATITLVKEYETDRRFVIYVHMQDKYTWKIVRIENGKMELEQSLKKA